MQLTDRQRGALKAICDTFAPGSDGLPPASDLGVVDAVLDGLALNPRESERKQVAQLMSLWDTAPLTALGGGGWRRFSALPQEERERVLRSWCDSRVPQRRAAFQALRKGALLMYYGNTGPNGGRSPVWDAIGYRGPLGPPRDPPPKAIEPIVPRAGERLECDVCIVGSGAGGGTAAGVLAAAGLDVIVLEAGDYHDDADFDGAELSGYMRLYMNGGGSASHDQSVGLIAGSTLGGGTVVNFTTSFRTPEEVRAEWASHGVGAFASDEYERSLDAVVERLGVNSEYSKPGARDEVMQRGLAELGWHVDRMPRNVHGCDQGEICGYCGFGCPLGAKRSTVKTWLHDAHQAGARIAVRTRAQRVLVEAGAARGVEAETAEGARVTIRARAVVAACGSIHTPALLKRSGLANENIGRHLRLHPATAVWGVLDEEIKPWEGTLQAVYSDQHRDLDNGYGLKYETAPVHPSLLLVFAPWRSAAQHAEMMSALPYTTPVGVLLRDRDGGEVRVGRDGHPVVRYRLSDYDAAHMRTGIDGGAQILEAAGARRIFSSHSRWVAYEPGRSGDRARFMREADATGYGSGRLTMSSFHIMGSARMGGSPATSACDADGQTWDARDLVVCDASAFPTAPGVNPMVSIEAVAHMNASRLAMRLAR
jgi:choline dehydrogenase-like flavoprotein